MKRPVKPEGVLTTLDKHCLDRLTVIVRYNKQLEAYADFLEDRQEKMWMHMNIMRKLLNTEPGEWTPKMYAYKFDLTDEDFLISILKQDEKA